MAGTTIEDRVVEHDGFTTNYLEEGEGPPVLLIHGSGPGVSARANWQGTLDSAVADHHRLLAPDVVGFGDTATPPGTALDHDARVEHLAGFMTAMGIERFAIVGNSMGGALALALAHRYPDRVERMILMGAVGISFPINPELDEVWGYEPSVDAMERLIRLFAFDQSLVKPEIVEMRYEASIVPGVQERYSEAFAAPRQRHVDAMALPEDALASITTPTLLIHGAVDRVVPLEETSLRLVRLLPNSELLVFARCGHWTMIEKARDFQRAVSEFLDRP